MPKSKRPKRPTKAQREQTRINDAVANALKAHGIVPGAPPAPAPADPEVARRRAAERAAERAKRTADIASLHETAARHRRAAKATDDADTKKRRDITVEAVLETAREKERELEAFDAEA